MQNVLHKKSDVIFLKYNFPSNKNQISKSLKDELANILDE
jgi:hypothetical protein